ncbi:LacI family DNA-binding transcriptional regulator [Acidicapsa ligni]|uniref:LacI family DNA-binding transcriptional regulator n=1 Tax=Acidicapsa ligni TaxID=542300 RepID=UPI0021E0D5D3|nr:LacI family DNA-binding transcriptional regulator [Acidicapsa ligni]
MTRFSNPPTLTDVARKAGVGTTTVSRVINGGERVSPETLSRVQAVIAELGFRPNQAARILKGNRAKTISLVIPSIADPFFAQCAEAVQVIARAQDSLLIVTVTNNDPRAEVENLETLVQHRTDGLLVVPANHQSRTLPALLQRMGVPVICLDRPLENAPFSSVVTKNFQAARDATKHLVDHGYKRILCLGGEANLYTIHERIRGYSRAMKDAKLVALIDMSAKDYKSTEQALEAHMGGTTPPDAILTLKNETTIDTFEVLQKFRISVPKQVALLGYDDFELASSLRPSITVVQQPISDLGRIAAEMLFAVMAQQPRGAGRSTEQVKLDTRLIVRSSCGCNPRGI